MARFVEEGASAHGTVTACKPDLENISPRMLPWPRMRLVGVFRAVHFCSPTRVICRCVRPGSQPDIRRPVPWYEAICLALLRRIRRGSRSARLPVLRSCVLSLISAGLEFGTTFVQRQSMPEESALVPARSKERQFSWNDAHACHTVKQTKKIHTDIHAERLLELGTLLPAFSTVIPVHVIREMYLGVVPGRQKPNFVHHSRQTAGSICTSREAQYAYLVTFSVSVHEEVVCFFDMKAEQTAECHVQGSFEAGAKSMRAICANSCLVIRDLGLVVLLEAADEVDNVAVIIVEFVARPVQTDYNGASVGMVLLCVLRRPYVFWDREVVELPLRWWTGTWFRLR